MSSLDKAFQTQLDNIQKKTGKSLDELTAIVKKSGPHQTWRDPRHAQGKTWAGSWRREFTRARRASI